MRKRYWLLIAILAIGMGIFLLSEGWTSSGITLPIIGWSLNPPEPMPTYPSRFLEINITEASMDKSIYKVGEVANMSFLVDNEFSDKEYNILVNWITNDTIQFSWINKSDELLSEGTGRKKLLYSTGNPVDKLGKWRVYILISYDLNEQKISKEEFLEFTVVK